MNNNIHSILPDSFNILNVSDSSSILGDSRTYNPISYSGRSFAKMGKLIDYIQYQLSRNENVLILIEGRTQMGKSTLAIQIALALNRYSLDNVVFETERFMDRLTNLQAGDVLIYDDAGVGISNQDWYMQDVKVFGRTSQTIGNKHLVVIITTPDMNFIEPQSRRLITILLQGDPDEKAVFRVKHPRKKTNITSVDQKIYYPYVRFKDRQTGKMLMIRQVRADRLPDEIYNPYNAKKNEFLDLFYTGKINIHALQKSVKVKRKMNPNSLKNLRHSGKKRR